MFIVLFRIIMEFNFYVDIEKIIWIYFWYLKAIVMLCLCVSGVLCVSEKKNHCKIKYYDYNVYKCEKKSWKRQIVLFTMLVHNEKIGNEENIFAFKFSIKTQSWEELCRQKQNTRRL